MADSALSLHSKKHKSPDGSYGMVLLYIVSSDIAHSAAGKLWSHYPKRLSPLIARVILISRPTSARSAIGIYAAKNILRLVSALSRSSLNTQKRFSFYSYLFLSYLFIFFWNSYRFLKSSKLTKIQGNIFSPMYTEFWFCGILIGIAVALVFRVSA